MRFCPFCTAENTVEATHCTACARRLPPVPQRRNRPSTSPSGITAPSGQGGPPATAGPASGPGDSGRRSLLAALSPSPSAERRPVPPPPSRPPGGQARRSTDFDERTVVDDQWGEPSPAPHAPAGAVPAPPPPPRQRSDTGPPPVPPRRKPTSIPPPVPGAAPPPTAGAQLASAALPAPPPGRPRTPSAPPPSGAPGAPGAPPRAKRPSMSPPLYPMARDAQDREAAAAGLAPAPVSPAPAGVSGAVPAPPPPSRQRTPTDGFSPLPTPAQRQLDSFEPPPTRILRGEELGDRPFAPPHVIPVPLIPEPGLISAARYAITFARARWQRRGAIKSLAEDIKRDTDALDQILGSLGRTARSVGLDGRVFAAENAAITAAETKRAALEHDGVDLQGRKSEESTKYVDVENERTTKVSQAEHQLGEAQRDLQHLEGQRRGLRDKRKDIERRQRGYLKVAQQRDEQADTAPGPQQRGFRSDAETHRKSAADLEPERQELDRKLAVLEKPIADATAKVDAAKAELESARRSLDDAREGHGHRLAELEAEQKRKAKEIAQAEAEIVRRLVTLGTLVNLNRVEQPEFADLYLRIDRLRTAIGARTTEIDKLTAERDAYDKSSLVRGIATLGGAVVLLLTLIVLLRACV